jgi:hypothetical protein
MKEAGIYRLNSLNWGRYMRQAGPSPTVVKFYADSCPKCKAAEAIYRDLGKVTLYTYRDGPYVGYSIQIRKA